MLADDIRPYKDAGEMTLKKHKKTLPYEERFVLQINYLRKQSLQ